MKSKYRLSSNAFKLEDEEEKIKPQKIFSYRLKEMILKKNILMEYVKVIRTRSVISEIEVLFLLEDNF